MLDSNEAKSSNAVAKGFQIVLNKIKEFETENNELHNIIDSYQENMLVVETKYKQVNKFHIMKDKNNYFNKNNLLEEEIKKLKEKYDSTLKMNNFQNTNIADLRKGIDDRQFKIEEVNYKNPH